MKPIIVFSQNGAGRNIFAEKICSDLPDYSLFKTSSNHIPELRSANDAREFFFTAKDGDVATLDLTSAPNWMLLMDPNGSEEKCMELAYTEFRRLLGNNTVDLSGIQFVRSKGYPEFLLPVAIGVILNGLRKQSSQSEIVIPLIDGQVAEIMILDGQFKSFQVNIRSA